MSQDKSELAQVEFDIKQMEDELKRYENDLEKAKLIEDFLESDVYKKVFKAVYIDGYRETAQANCALFNIQQTTNFVHGMKARAYLVDFMERTKEEGLVAVVAIEEFKEELKIAYKKI